MLNYWWIPVIAIVSIFQAYITIRSNAYGGIWVYIVLISSINPAWALITRISKDIVFDGFVYDITASIFYAIAILYFSDSFHKFSVSQYTGIIVILLGMFLFKRGI